MWEREEVKPIREKVRLPRTLLCANVIDPIGEAEVAARHLACAALHFAPEKKRACADEGFW